MPWTTHLGIFYATYLWWSGGWFIFLLPTWIAICKLGETTLSICCLVHQPSWVMGIPPTNSKPPDIAVMGTCAFPIQEKSSANLSWFDLFLGYEDWLWSRVGHGGWALRSWSAWCRQPEHRSGIFLEVSCLMETSFVASENVFERWRWMMLLVSTKDMDCLAVIHQYHQTSGFPWIGPGNYGCPRFLQQYLSSCNLANHLFNNLGKSTLVNIPIRFSSLCMPPHTNPINSYKQCIF